jgi:hypothetical protein
MLTELRARITRLAPVARLIAPAVAALLLVVIAWDGLAALAARIPGPPGFDVLTKERDGGIVAHVTAPTLLTPEVAPTPPPGGSLVARGTFLARDSGTYKWRLGCTAPCTLRVDGQPVLSPRPGRVGGTDQPLTAGAHALEVTLPSADNAGGVAFGVQLPSSPWRAPLIGPGDVVTSPSEVVAQRLGAHATLILRALPLIPFIGILIITSLFLISIGQTRRQRLLGYLSRLRQNPTAQKLGIALLWLAIVLPMIWPLSQPGFYACHEEESYIVRLIEYDKSLRAGVPFSRWWDDPVLGRGYPFLCLYAPLLYLVATPFLLLGIPSLITVKIVSGLVVIVGALATFTIVRRRGSRPSALVATALFTYAPYLQTDLWVRADLAESLGFACFPVALLALDRILDRRAPDTEDSTYRDIALLAFALFALGSCHNITAYFSVYYLGLWLVLRVALRTSDVAGLRRAIAGAALGLGLTVSYAIPAIGDAKRVWMVRVMTGYYYPFNNFVAPLKTITADPRWGTMQLYVGVAATLATVAGLAALFNRRFAAGEPLRGGTPGARGLALYAGSCVLLALLLATPPLGVPFVRYVPLAIYVQFPWRMFLFAACLAPLPVAAALDSCCTSPRRRWLVAFAAVAVLMAVKVPMSGPREPLVRSHLDVPRFLRSLDTDYVTSMNEYLPITVQRTVPRFGDVAHVSAGNARITDESRAPGHYRCSIDAAEAATVEFNAHWFPGWRARVDGGEVLIGPGNSGFDNGGLIRVRVPVGRHEVRIDYGRTPLRLACDLFSLAALLVALGLLVPSLRRARVRRA